MKNTTLVSTAMFSLMSLGAASMAGAQDSQPAPGASKSKEKCFGIAKAGKNGCANANHACAGYAKADNLPDEWVLVAKGTCLKVGGQLAADANLKKS